MLVLGGCVFSSSQECQLQKIINAAIMASVGEKIAENTDIDI
jgi:hypothetical protein